MFDPFSCKKWPLVNEWNGLEVQRPLHSHPFLPCSCPHKVNVKKVTYVFYANAWPVLTTSSYYPLSRQEQASDWCMKWISVHWYREISFHLFFQLWVIVKILYCKNSPQLSQLVIYRWAFTSFLR